MVEPRQPLRAHSGENHSRARISEEQAKAIIKDPRSQKEIAADYRISFAEVSSIKQGLRWAHLDRSEVKRNPRGGSRLVSDNQGERRFPQARLTEVQAMAILSDSRPTKEIASEFGITRQAVHDIKDGRTWAHLDRSSVFKRRRAKRKPKSGEKNS